MDQTSQPTFEGVAVDRGYITPAQLEECRELHRKLGEMGLPSAIEEVFLKKAYLTKQQIAAINAVLGKGNADAIPGYVILEKIATGGMGTVYKAKQTSMDRIVALKTLLPKFANEADSRERFLREARAVAKLSHPNIVSGIDSGEAHGIYYFVMEFLDGEPLDRVLRKRTRLPWREAATMVRQIALALDHAHKNSMVHRDVKPGNIMLLKDGSVKLADLGLARVASAGDAALTRSGMIVGSPGYVSPEQATGERDLDIRSDIYSLGLTLFEAIAGEPAYSGDSPMTVISARLTRDPHFEKLAAFDAPKDLVALVTKMCAREAIRRYQTPQYLLEDLDAILRGSRALHAVSAGVQASHGHSSGVHSVHTERRLHKPPPRRSALPAVIAASVGAVVVAVVLAAVLRPSDGEKPAPVVAGRPAPPPSPVTSKAVPAKVEDPRLAEADERALRAWKMAQKFEEENDEPQQLEEVITVYKEALDASAGTLLASQVKAKLDGLSERLAKLMKAIGEDIDTEMREFESRHQFGESRKLAEMAAALFSDAAWKKSMGEKSDAALKRAHASRDALIKDVDGLIGRGDYLAAAEKLSTGFGIEEIDRELALRRGSIEKQRGDLAAAAERDRKADRAALDAAIPRMLDQARGRDTTGALKTADELFRRLRAADTKAEGQLYRDWIGAAHRVVDGARGAFLKMKGGERVSFDVRVAGKLERVEGSVVTASGDAVIVGDRSVALRELAVADLVSLSGVRADLRGPALLAVLERDAGMKKYVEAAQKAKLEFPSKVLAEYQAVVDEEATRAAETEATRAKEKEAEAALVETERLAAQKKLDEALVKLEKFLEEFASTSFARRSDARVKKLQALFPKEIVLWATDGRGPREWSLRDDPASAGGKVWVSASGRANWGSAQGNPYVEFKFTAMKGMRYRMWMRMKCGANRPQQNALGYQISDAVDGNGGDWMPIGGNRARILQFWTGDQTPERGWTCHDQYNAPNADLEGYGFTFRSSGEKTLRICIVEDGSGFDQVVISAEKYLDAPPGSDEIIKKK